MLSANCFLLLCLVVSGSTLPIVIEGSGEEGIPETSSISPSSTTLPTIPLEDGNHQNAGREDLISAPSKEDPLLEKEPLIQKFQLPLNDLEKSPLPNKENNIAEKEDLTDLRGDRFKRQYYGDPWSYGYGYGGYGGYGNYGGYGSYYSPAYSVQYPTMVYPSYSQGFPTYTYSGATSSYSYTPYPPMYSPFSYGYYW